MIINNVKRKKLFVFGSLLFIMLLGTIFFIPTNNEVEADKVYDPELKQFAMEFRKIYGFDSTESYFLKVSKENKIDKEIEKKLGFSLTDEEIRIISEREEIENSIPSLVEKTKEVTTGYAGVYYVTETGDVVIKLVNNDDNIKNKIKSKYKFPSNVKFEKAEYSESELEMANQKLLENPSLLEGSEITAFGVDIKSNRFEIYLKDLKNKEIKKSIENVIDPKIIVYKEGETTLAAGLSERSRPVLSGLKISNGSGNCSVGFHAEMYSTNTPVLVTAGHCYQQNYSTWYQPHKDTSAWFDDDSIGKWETRTSGATTADAGVIKLDKADYQTNKAWASSSSTNSLTSVFSGSESVGSAIIKVGHVSGRTIGKITNTNYSININQHGYTTISNLTLTDTYTEPGDSGGVVHNYVSSGNYQLRGIVTAQIGTNKHMAYSKVQNIISLLGVKNIKIK